MVIENALRSIAGAFILASVGLGFYVSPWWLLFTAFVGVNLLQSGFTGWCPMMWFLQRLGLRHEGQAVCCAAQEDPRS